MDNVIKFEAPKPQEGEQKITHCSFCEKPLSQCESLIASSISPHAVCDLCIKQAKLQISASSN